MPPSVLAFNAALATLFILAWALGGRTSRQVATFSVIAAAGSYVCGRGFEQSNGAVLLIDSALLMGLLWVVIRADEHWPIFSAALQLLTTLGHLARIENPNIWPIAFAIMRTWTAWPSLVVLAFGIILHRRSLHASSTLPRSSGGHAGNRRRLLGR